MEEEQSVKKTAKRKHTKPAAKAKSESESEDSDNEITDFGNGAENDIDADSNLSDDGWSSDDDRELVQKVKSTSKENDKVSFKTRLKQLKWTTIAFKNYSADDCKKRFDSHLKHIRKHRNLSEIATDIEANIKKCPLKKPLNSYQLFVQEQLANVKSSGDFSETMKNLASRYKSLSPEEQLVYKKRADQLSEEYKAKKQEFLTGNVPKTPKVAASKCKNPADLFVENTGQSREEYAKQSLDEKYKWITKAISLAPDEPVTKLLSKEEINLMNGRAKITPAAYNLYVKETYSKLRDKYDKKDLFTEVAQRWKSLDPKKKKVYMEAAALLKEKAFKEQEEFNARHGLTPQKMKRRKSVYVEQAPEDASDQEEQVEPELSSPKPKKRKISDSSALEGSDTNTFSIKLPTKPKKATPVKQQAPKITTPLKTIEKAREKLFSESDERSGREESDAVNSSTSTGSKKKSKKEKKSKVIEPPGNKPPSNLFKYFAKHIHTGKPHKAEKAFNKLTKKEQKQLNAEYNEKVESYVAKLKSYLASLPKDEALAYISKVKQAEDAEQKQVSADEEESSQEY